MNKILTCGLGAALLVTASTSAFAEELPAESFIMNYGFSMTSPEQSMQEDLVVKSNGESAGVSATVTINDGNEAVTVELPNYVLGTPDGTYINLQSLINAVASQPGAEEVASVVEGLGITDEWIKIATIDLGALSMEFIPYEGAMPQLSEEAMGDLQNLLMGAMKVEMTDTGVTYVIDNETLSNTAAGLDAFKDKHLGFVGDALTYAQENLSHIGELDVKPAIRNYIDAAAEGLALVSGESVEDSAAFLDSMIDSALAEPLSMAAAAIEEYPVADMWNSISVSQLADQFLIGNEIEAKLEMGEAIKCAITVNGQTLEGDVAIDGDTCVVTLGTDEGVVGSLELTMGENGSAAVVKDGEGNVLSSSACEFTVENNLVNGTFDLTSAAAGVDFHGYIDMENWEDDGSLETPESSLDVLDLVKTASAFVFQNMFGSDQAE